MQRRIQKEMDIGKRVCEPCGARQRIHEEMDIGTTRQIGCY
jgi:hypothetical protein